MERESFVFYKSFHDAITELDDAEYGKVMRIINEYALTGAEPENLTGIAKIVFTLIKPQIIANNKRFENGAKGAEFGAKGGRPSKNKETPSNTKQDTCENPTGDTCENPTGDIIKTPNVNVNDNVNVNVNDNVCSSSDIYNDFSKTELEQEQEQQPQLQESFCDKKILDETASGYGMKLFKTVQNLNAQAAFKLPINTSELAFLNTECRDFLCAAKGIHSDSQLAAIRNLYEVLNLPHARYKPQTWCIFCASLSEYLPENFTLSRYVANDKKQAGGLFVPTQKDIEDAINGTFVPRR